MNCGMLPLALSPDSGDYMFAAPPNDALGNLQIKRVTALYDSTLSSLISIVVGVVLVFLFLSPSADAALLKLWVVSMLSTVALRGCLWAMFRASNVDGQNARHWEFGFAFSMCLSGIGWGTLSGALYPAGETLRVFILVLAIITAFSGAIYASVSRLSFFMFALPTVVPGLMRFVFEQKEAYQLFGWLASAGCVLVLVNIHQILYRSAIRHLHHETELENLLAEQETIFQTVTAGIAIVRNGRAIKCNTRLGEILGRSLKDIQATPMADMLTSAEDVDAILAASAAAHNDGTPFYSLFRMRRGNGSVFWADISARRMSRTPGGDVIWLISDVGLREKPV